MENNKIILYLSGEMTDSEKVKFETRLSNDLILQKEVEKYRLKFAKLNNFKSMPTELPNDFRSNILVNTNERIALKRKMKPIINIRYGLSFSLVILFALLIKVSENTPKQNTFLSFSKNEKQIMKEIAADKEAINDIYHTDIVTIQTGNTIKSIEDNYLSDIQEIAKYDKDFLNRNNIPIVDEINLNESISDEQIEELFSKLDTYN